MCYHGRTMKGVILAAGYGTRFEQAPAWTRTEETATVAPDRMPQGSRAIRPAPCWTLLALLIPAPILAAQPEACPLGWTQFNRSLGSRTSVP